METYLTMNEAAKVARVSRQTIWRWMKAGLPVYRPSWKVLIKESDLKAWIERGAK